MSRIRVVPTKWDDALQDYVQIPLDDADPASIELMRRTRGRELTEDEYQALIAWWSTQDHTPG